MKVELTKSAGFCFGVGRAVDMVSGLLNSGKKVYTLGPIIHNPQFVSELERKGAKIIEKPEEAGSGGIVVVRTHGVPESVYAELSAAGAEICDATCPFVAKIHDIAKKAGEEGAALLIAGDPEHPEVQGIVGHCPGASFVYQNFNELEELFNSHHLDGFGKIFAVSQTTFNTELWEKCNDFIKKVYTNAIIFDTICNATSIRQKEAKELAARSDIMIVIGGKKSSNTAKLRAVCAQHCPTFHVEGADELPVEYLRKAQHIGVTAGASTPACIIKEVLIAMADLDNMDSEDISFADALEKSFKTISSDDTVRGVVVGYSLNEVQVDVGTKHAGYVPLSELTDDTSAKPEQLVNIGDELDLVVLRVNDQDGTVLLSKKRFDAIRGWNDIVKANEEDEIVSGTVTDVVKGGVLASVSGIKVFIPASQSGVMRNEKLEKLLNTKVDLKIIEINRGRKRAVGSIRQVIKEERKKLADQFWNEVEVDKEYTGKVKSLTSYGAFVDLGGVDGMIHVSELSWTHIKNPSEVVKVGDEVHVYVKSFDPEAKRVSLGYKDKGENPWSVFVGKYSVGDIVDAQIVSFMPFGAFAQIIPGVDGLIHISQISDTHVAKPQDVLEEGQTVKAKIIEIDEDRKRISLSMREAEGTGSEEE